MLTRIVFAACLLVAIPAAAQNVKITDLTEGTTLDLAADPLVFVDTSDTTQAATGTTKKLLPETLLQAGGTTLGTASTPFTTVYASSQILFDGTAGPVTFGCADARTINFKNNNVNFASVNTGGDWTFAGSQTFGWSNVQLTKDADDTLALKRSTNAQTLNIYNTDDGAGNYERAYFRMQSNALQLGTESAGTGSNRVLDLQYAGSTKLRMGNNVDVFANTVPFNNSSYYLGGNGKAWRGIYIGDGNADPGNSVAGQCVIWQSDGTGSGDDGDIMISITDSGGTTKTTTLIDFSALP